MHDVEIADKAALCAVMEDIKKRHGTDKAAARALGLNTRDTFRNLRVGVVKGSIEFETFASIYRYLGGDPRRFGRAPWPTEFAPAVEGLDRMRLTPAQAADLEALRRRTEAKSPQAAADPQAFLDAEAQAEYDLYERFMSSVVLEDVQLVWSNYEEWMRRELERIRPNRSLKKSASGGSG